MKDINEEDLIMYEEIKEIKETIWKVWDLLNDNEIINKIILNSSLIDELEKIKSQTSILLKENKTSDKTNNISSIKNKLEKNGK